MIVLFAELTLALPTAVLQVSNDVRSDAHFECQVARLKWEDYEHELRTWAAAKARALCVIMIYVDLSAYHGMHALQTDIA
jgi:hypothetical protein